MKKLLSLIAAFALVFSIGSPAFATPTDPTIPDGDVSSGKIKKHILLENSDSVSPAEDYNFTITPLDGAPAFPGTQPFAASLGESIISGATGEIALPVFTATGAYKYEVKEVAGDTAGMVYDGRTLILTVYVFSDGNGGFVRNITLHDSQGNEMTKVDGFTNKFKSGKLVVEKKVTGNMGEQNREFNITVKLNIPEGKKINNVTVEYSGGTYVDVPVTFTDGVATLNLQIKHDEKITFANLPYGTAWEVSEEDYSASGYTTTIVEDDGFIGAPTVTSLITNHKDMTVNTGVNLDNLPYILLLAVAAGGLFIFAMRRRAADR